MFGEETAPHGGLGDDRHDHHQHSSCLEKATTEASTSIAQQGVRRSSVPSCVQPGHGHNCTKVPPEIDAQLIRVGTTPKEWMSVHPPVHPRSSRALSTPVAASAQVLRNILDVLDESQSLAARAVRPAVTPAVVPERRLTRAQTKLMRLPGGAPKRTHVGHLWPTPVPRCKVPFERIATRNAARCCR